MAFRILVLEDDEVSAQVLSGMLEPAGHRVALAAKSAEAWAELRKEPTDLLVLDTNLDGEQGWEFLETVRLHPLFGPLPVVVYSGVSQRGVVQKYMRLGVQGMLVKPYAADRLTAEVDRLTQTCWRDKLFEPLDAVRARSGLNDEKLAELLRNAAREIDRVLAEVGAQIMRDPGDVDSVRKVTALRGLIRNVGFHAIEKILNDAEKGAQNFDQDRVTRMVTDLPVAIALLRDRANKLAPEQEAAMADSGTGAVPAIAEGDASPAV